MGKASFALNAFERIKTLRQTSKILLLVAVTHSVINQSGGRKGERSLMNCINDSRIKCVIIKGYNGLSKKSKNRTDSWGK